MRPWIVVALASFPIANTAHADCEFVISSQAVDAAARVNHAEHTIRFCEPCGDKAPGAPRAIRSALAWRVERSLDAVLTDGHDIDQAIDLASTYIQISPWRYQNLATIVGCANTRTAFLNVEHETPDGVLIVADRGEVPQVLPPAPYSPPAYVTMPPAMIIIPAVSSSMWPAAIAGGSAAAIWAAWAFAAIRRRRRTMRPRAAYL